ncbi:MAG: glycosyltransferase family 9 protein [Candidatus Firestonebacteria bacterium]
MQNNNNSSYKNILILRLSSLGDVVLATSVIPVLKDRFPEAKISFLTSAKYVNVLQNNPYIDEIIEIKRYNLISFFRFVIGLRNKRFDLVIDLHFNPKTVVISMLCGGKVRLRYKKGILRRRFMVFVARLRALLCLITKKTLDSQLLGNDIVKIEIGDIKKYVHTIERYLIVFDKFLPVQIQTNKALPVLYPSEDDKKYVSKILQDNSATKIIGVFSGGKWAIKRWGASGFAKTGDLCWERYGAKSIILGDEKDKKIMNEVASMMKYPPVIINEQLTILQLAALIGKCKLFVTNDTGPMHIAVAMKVPVLAIFGPTVLEFGFGPLGEKDRTVFAKIPCKPCVLHGGKHCLIKSHICMESINPENVFKIIESMNVL